MAKTVAPQAAHQLTSPSALKPCTPTTGVQPPAEPSHSHTTASACTETQLASDCSASKVTELRPPGTSTESRSPEPLHSTVASHAGRVKSKRQSPVPSTVAPQTDISTDHKKAKTEEPPTTRRVATRGSSASGKQIQAAAATAISTPRRSTRKSHGPAVNTDMTTLKRPKAAVTAISKPERKPPEPTPRRISRRTGGKSPARYSQEDWVIQKPFKVKQEPGDKEEDGSAGEKNKRKQARRGREKIQDNDSDTEDLTGTVIADTGDVTGDENMPDQGQDAEPQLDAQADQLCMSHEQSKDCSGENCPALEEDKVLRQVQKEDTSDRVTAEGTGEVGESIQGVAAVKSDPEEGCDVDNIPGPRLRIAHGVPVSHDPVDPVSERNKGYLQCSECDKLFKNTTGLNIHIQWHHSKLEPVREGWKEHQCEHCDKVLKSFQALLCHERRIHGTFRNFSCEHCDQAFDSNKKLKRHLLDAHDMGHIMCDVCGEKFRTREGHRIHTFKQHSKGMSAKKLNGIYLTC